MHQGRGVQPCRQPPGHPFDADVEGDVPLQRRVRQSQAVERRRDAVARMVGHHDRAGAAVRVQPQVDRGVVRADDRQAGVHDARGRRFGGI